MRIKIHTERGFYHFLYAKRIWEFNSLVNAITAANSISWHSLQLQLNVYTDSGIVLHA